MDLRPDSPRALHPSVKKDVPWFQKLSRPILFLIVTAALGGAYLAFSIPVAVFPNTDFPRIVVGVDNGVMPIDQMLVTITRPLEEAVNSVPGLLKVQSITSRGSAEVDLFFASLPACSRSCRPPPRWKRTVSPSPRFRFSDTA